MHNPLPQELIEATDKLVEAVKTKEGGIFYVMAVPGPEEGKVTVDVQFVHTSPQAAHACLLGLEEAMKELAQATEDTSELN